MQESREPVDIDDHLVYGVSIADQEQYSFSDLQFNLTLFVLDIVFTQKDEDLSFLVNGHFDSPLGSPGATDCGSCVGGFLLNSFGISIWILVQLRHSRFMSIYDPSNIFRVFGSGAGSKEARTLEATQNPTSLLGTIGYRATELTMTVGADSSSSTYATVDACPNNFYSIEIKQVLQSPENDILYIVGIAGSSKLNLYQLNAKTGEVVKHIQESFPGTLCGEALLVSRNVLVALDETRSVEC
ncbi:hypothetical protein ABZP36_030619 [Zizania latifolia]